MTFPSDLQTNSPHTTGRPIHSCTGVNGDTRTLEQLRTQRDQLDTRLDKGIAFLNDLAQRVGQNSPEYTKHFTAWQVLYDEFNQVCDRLMYAEMNEELRRIHPPLNQASA